MKNLVGSMILASAFVLASTANAGDTPCGAVDGETLALGSHDNVIVVGGTCNVSTDGTTEVKGDLKVESGGTLSAILDGGGELIVKGNVQCDFCDSVFLGAFAGGLVTVKGDFQIKGASGPSGGR